MKELKNMKWARVFGPGSRLKAGDKVLEAIELLKKAGYNIIYTPLSDILGFEAQCHPIKGEPMRITDLKTLRDFLAGKKIPRSMWTLVDDV